MAIMLIHCPLKWLTRSTCHRSLYGIRALHSTPRRAEVYLKADIETFNKVVNTKDRLVLVDFYADWCAPCKQLSPILEQIASDPNTRSGSKLPVDLVAVDTDETLSLAQKFKIRGLPTVIAFRNGGPVGQFVGSVPRATVDEFLNGV